MVGGVYGIGIGVGAFYSARMGALLLCLVGARVGGGGGTLMLTSGVPERRGSRRFSALLSSAPDHAINQSINQSINSITKSPTQAGMATVL